MAIQISGTPVIDDSRNIVNAGSGAFNDFVRTDGNIISGLGSGGVALTINDGGGNSNITFNHVGRVPEQDGVAGRIVVNTDATGGTGEMNFQIGDSVTNGVSVNLTEILELRTSQSTFFVPLLLDSSHGQLFVGETGQSGLIKFGRGSDGAPAGFLGFSSAAEASEFDVFVQGGGAQMRLGGQDNIIFRTGADRDTATTQMSIDSAGLLTLQNNIKLDAANPVIYSNIGGAEVEIRANNGQSTTSTRVVMSARGVNDVAAIRVDDIDQVQVTKDVFNIVNATDFRVASTVNRPGNGNTNTGVTVDASDPGLYVSRNTFTCATFNVNEILASQLSVISIRRGGSAIGTISANDTTVQYNTSSDERLKHNIASVESGKSGGILDTIDVREFNWNVSGKKQEFGLIAQEVEPIYPEAVTHDKSEDAYYVDYSKFVPLLLAEIKELRKRVSTLEQNQ